MEMKKQPEALRLAERLDLYSTGDEHQRDVEQAAAELRRLHEVETKYHESVGGFKRDLAEKLEQQRKKNIRLTDELRRLEKDYVARDAELRRLHEVNAELVEVNVSMVMCLEMVDNPLLDELRTKARAAIAKATGEQQ